MILSELWKNILLTIIKRHDSPQQLVKRAKIVLLAADRQTDQQIASQVGLCRETVLNWRKRWNAQAEKLAAIEADGDEKHYENSSSRSFSPTIPTMENAASILLNRLRNCMRSPVRTRKTPDDRFHIGVAANLPTKW